MVEVVGAQPRPASMHLGAGQAAAGQQHGVAVAVIDTAAAVLRDPAAELAQRHHRHPVEVRTEVGGEGRESLGHLTDQRRELALAGVAQGDVHVPTADLERERRQPDVGADQCGGVAQRGSQTIAFWVGRAVAWALVVGPHRGEGGEGVEGRPPRRGVRQARIIVQRPQRRDHRGAERLRRVQGEGVQGRQRQHVLRAGEQPRSPTGPERDRLERRAGAVDRDDAVEPTAVDAPAGRRPFQFGRGREMAAGGIGGADRVHERQPARLPQRAQRGEGGMQAEPGVPGRDGEARRYRDAGPGEGVVGVAHRRHQAQPVHSAP